MVTGLASFPGRDGYATVIAYNFLGLIGVIGSTAPAALCQPLFPLYGLRLDSLEADEQPLAPAQGA